MVDTKIALNKFDFPALSIGILDASTELSYFNNCIIHDTLSSHTSTCYPSDVFYLDDFLYYTFFTDFKSRKSLNRLHFKDANRGQLLMNIHLKLSQFSHLVVIFMFHQPNVHPNRRRMPFIWKNSLEPWHLQISFRKMVVRKLPTTNCYVQRRGGKSFLKILQMFLMVSTLETVVCSQCMRNCVRPEQKFTQNCSSLAKWSKVLENKSSQFLHCLSGCEDSRCLIEHYEALLLQDLHETNEVYRADIHYPTSISFTLYSRRKYSTIDLIVYFGNCLGLWCGLDLLKLLLLFRRKRDTNVAHLCPTLTSYIQIQVWRQNRYVMY